MHRQVVAAGVAATLVGLAALPIASAAPRTVSFVSVVKGHKQDSSHYSATGEVDRGKSKVGTIGYACTFSSDQKTCSGTIRAVLADGTLRLKYVYVSADPRRTSIRISGGTGAYAGAQGTGTYTPLDAFDSRQAIKLHLR